MAADGQYSDCSDRGNLENHTWRTVGEIYGGRIPSPDHQPHRAYDGETIRATVERLMFEADMADQNDDLVGYGMVMDALDNVWTWVYANV